jgi:hypothetical protein
VPLFFPAYTGKIQANRSAGGRCLSLFSTKTTLSKQFQVMMSSLKWAEVFFRT